MNTNTLKHIRKQIDTIIEERGIDKRDFVSECGFQLDNYYKMFNREVIKLKTFLRMCEVLEVEPYSLFPGNEPIKREFETLGFKYEKENFEQQKKYVKILEDQIELLKFKVENLENKIKDN